MRTGAFMCTNNSLQSIVRHASFDIEQHDVSMSGGGGAGCGV